MKKRGTQSRTEMISMATEKRGMTRSDMPVRFMITPPSSIPTAIDGRFTAPGDHDNKQTNITTHALRSE